MVVKFSTITVLLLCTNDSVLSANDSALLKSAASFAVGSNG